MPNHSVVANALQAARLYAILDLGYVSRQAVVSVAEQLVAGGVDVLQVRAKDCSADEVADISREIVGITRDGGVPLIINDFPDVALEVGADGVHVGQDDRSIDDVRGFVGTDMIVGKSTHSVAQAREASQEAVDYIGFGPLFATPTKPDYVPIGLQEIATVNEELSLPIFCIGGIKRENLGEVLGKGARRVVIVSGILQSEDPGGYIDDCQRQLSGEPL